MKKETIKVLIADDSMLMRVLIKDLLNTDTSLEIIGTAQDGQSAFLSAQELKPDVILMDINMGEYDGLYGIQQIMTHCPTPIIILSAVGNQDMNRVMEGLVLGAVDYVNKPVKNSIHLQDIRVNLLEKIQVASKTQLKPLAEKAILEKNVYAHSFDSQLNFDIIVIGASTGGPGAVEQIITNLPENLPVPVLVIQHMPQHFIPSFAERLNKLSPLSILVPKKGEVIEKGKIFLVPADANTFLKIEFGKVVVDFTQEKYKAYNYPSVDSVMVSAARIYGNKCIGVILTGMGRDGALGTQTIKEAGGYTIAQSEDTCVVYGMPKAAVEEGNISRIVKLKDISGFLVSCLS